MCVRFTTFPEGTQLSSEDSVLSEIEASSQIKRNPCSHRTMDGEQDSMADKGVRSVNVTQWNSGPTDVLKSHIFCLFWIVL